jgi:hypothetical protein
MEIAIPLLALSGLYVISNQQSKKAESEGFDNNNLPNTNIPNRNFPTESPIISAELDRTDLVSHNNRYDGGRAYTDKFFDQSKSNNRFKIHAHSIM